MSNQKDDTGWILLFCLFLLLCVGIYYALRAYFRTQKRNKFVSEQVQEHGMSEETANVLFRVSCAQDHFINAEKYSNSNSYRGRIDKDEIEYVQADEYYQLLRWRKSLYEALHEDAEALEETVERVMNELNTRANQCLVPFDKKQSLIALIKTQHESFLQKFDHVRV